MLPCERRQAGQQMIRDSLSCTAQGIDDAADIDCVPVNDGGDNQIESGCPDRQVFLTAIAETAETMKIDCPNKAVPAFALVQFSGSCLSQLLVVDPVEGEEGSFNPSHLAQRLGKTALPRCRRQSLQHERGADGARA